MDSLNGGSLIGNTSQMVDHGAEGTAVTAVADATYYFDWSDGSPVNPRTDSNVQANVDVIANFAIDTYTLNIELTGKGGGNVISQKYRLQYNWC